MRPTSIPYIRDLQWLGIYYEITYKVTTEYFVNTQKLLSITSIFNPVLYKLKYKNDLTCKLCRETWKVVLVLLSTQLTAVVSILRLNIWKENIVKFLKNYFYRNHVEITPSTEVESDKTLLNEYLHKLQLPINLPILLSYENKVIWTLHNHSFGHLTFGITGDILGMIVLMWSSASIWGLLVGFLYFFCFCIKLYNSSWNSTIGLLTDVWIFCKT